MLALLLWCVPLVQDPVDKDVEDAIKRLASEKYAASQDARMELIETGAPAVGQVAAALRAEFKKVEELSQAKKKLEEIRKTGTFEEIKKAKDEVDRLTKAQSDNPQLRHMLCEILGGIRNPGKDGEATKVLLDAVNDKGEYGTSVASAAAAALASIGDRSAAGALLAILKDKRVDTDKQLKYECIRALGLFRHTEAVEVLRKALEDKKTTAVDQHDEYAHTIAAAAADALGRIRSKDAIEDVGKLLGDMTPDPFSQQKLSWHAARALERIEGARKEGALDGDAKQVDEAIKAWKTWYDTEFMGRKNVADSKKKVDAVSDAIAKFRADVKRLPLVLEELSDKPTNAPDWKGPYYKSEDPKADKKKLYEDGWGRKLEYRTPGTGTAGTDLDFDLLSFGADGLPWGGGVNADLYNHEKWIAVLQQRNKERFDEVTKAVQQFKTDNDRLPNTLLELVAKPTTAKKWEKPYVGAAKYDAAREAINRFQADQGRFPLTLQDLKTKPADAKKWEKPYLEDLTDAFGSPWVYKVAPDGKSFELAATATPEDAFDAPYVYKVNSKDDYELTSLGADRAPGGTGIDADLTNKPKDEKKDGNK